MAIKYKAVNAAGNTSSEGTLLYTVPQGRTAKVTFVSCLNSNAYLGIKPSGAGSIIVGPTLAHLAYAAGTGANSTNALSAANCADMGIYLSAGDELYAMGSSAYGFYVSLIEEYED